MNNIYIYGSKDCSHCNALKAYFHIKNIIFNYIELSEAPTYIQDLNCNPVVEINGNRIEGFDIKLINRLLNINNTSGKFAYLDNAATTPLDPKVYSKIKLFLTKYFANPSSEYSLGIDNKQAIEDARSRIASDLRCNSSEIFFTSGGSESNNTAIKAVAYANSDRGNHIITSKIEHSSILNSCSYLQSLGFDITYLDVDDKGCISLEQLKESITEKTILISIMAVNNEVGVIQDIDKIGEIAREHNIYFHTDAVQAIGKIDINLNNSNINLLSISGHKFGAPKGIGALYIKNGTRIDSYIHGGGQEHEFRSGTENVAFIVAMASALNTAISERKSNNLYLDRLEKIFIDEMSTRSIKFKLNGYSDKRVPGYLNITFDGEDFCDNIILKFLLDINNIYVSSGSACSENKHKSSHVLKAMGLSEDDIRKTLRFTLSKNNTEDEIIYTVRTLNKILLKLNKKNP